MSGKTEREAYQMKKNVIIAVFVAFVTLAGAGQAVSLESLTQNKFMTLRPSTRA